MSSIEYNKSNKKKKIDELSDGKVKDIIKFDKDLKMLVRIFLHAFPTSILWTGRPNDYLLIGRKDGGETPDLAMLSARMQHNPGLATFFRFLGGEPIEQLLTGFALGPEELKAFAGNGPLNTDDQLHLEFSAPRALYLGKKAVIDTSVTGLRRKGRKSFPPEPLLKIRSDEEAHLHLQLAKRYLFQDQAKKALSEIKWVKRLEPNQDVSSRRNGRELSLQPPQSIKHEIETFDGEPLLPLFARIGNYRPAGSQSGYDNDLLRWSASFGYFQRVAGIKKSIGREGSRGMTVRGIPGVGSTAYFSPLPIDPSATYTVELWAKSDATEQSVWGVGWFEFDRFTTESKQPSKAFIDEHLVLGKNMIRMKGAKEWEKYSFSLTPSEESMMGHLLFYWEGAPDGKSVVFDNIKIEMHNYKGSHNL